MPPAHPLPPGGLLALSGAPLMAGHAGGL
jgi:hypothetical protein